jgi:hypothetical protein
MYTQSDFYENKICHYLVLWGKIIDSTVIDNLPQLTLHMSTVLLLYPCSLSVN